MARLSVPYLITKPGKAGAVRCFWQPSTVLRKLGWKPLRLADELGQATEQARAVNALLADWKMARERGDKVATPAGLLDRLAANWAASDPAASQAVKFDVLARPNSPAVEPLPQPGTVSLLIDAFLAHRRFAGKAAKTRRFYRQNLELIRRWGGDLPIGAITQGRLETFHDALAVKAPRTASAMVQSARRLWNWAATQDRFAPLIQINPAARIELDFDPATKPRLWTDKQVAHMVATADAIGRPAVGTAILLAEWLGQRQGDILALPRAAWADGWFAIDQAKTGAAAEIPESPALRTRIEAELARQDAAGLAGVTLLLNDLTGQPYDEHAFRRQFAEVRRAAAQRMAGCAGLKYMQLRHTAVTRLAEAGSTTPEIASITGHTLRSVDAILERYLVRTKRLAQNAVAKRLAKEGGGGMSVTVDALLADF